MHPYAWCSKQEQSNEKHIHYMQQNHSPKNEWKLVKKKPIQMQLHLLGPIAQDIISCYEES